MRRLSIALITAAFILSVQAASADLALVKNGKTDYAIIVGKDASPSEKHAVHELVYYLNRISGATLPILTDPAKLAAHCVYVGDSIPLRKSGARLDYTCMGEEGFCIQTLGDDLVITGGKLRGTMYGVYTFLDEVLGCRWYSSKVTRIPAKSTIVLGTVGMVRSPAFEYREPFYRDAFDADWAAHNRCNSSASTLDEERGGKVSFGSKAFCHTFASLVPPDKYFKDHPEYYSLVNGNRIHAGAQLCLTNPDVLQIATAQVLEWIEAEPSAKLFSVSQNDCGNPCQCPNCRKIVEEEGSESGPLIRFVNAIAAEVGKRYQGKLIETLAYQYTKEPPKITRPAPNVRIRLCPIENCIVHPFEKCPNNAAFVDILKRWSRITDSLYIWHYCTNFGHYLQPNPNWDELFADIPMYKRSGAKGIFMQGNYSPGGSGEFDELRAYVIAKMLWNPSIDPWAVVDDFLDGYYGKAGRPLRKYIDFLMARVRDKEIHTGIYTGPETKYFEGDFLQEANRLFDEAEKAVKDDPAALERVRHARLSVEYVDIMYKYWWKDKSQVDEAEVNRWCDKVKAAGITNVSEGYTVDVFRDKMINKN